MLTIIYPYLPENREIRYVSEGDLFMQAAKMLWKESSCVKHPTAAVVVKEGRIIGIGSNAGIKVDVCARWGSPTGTNYGPCREVCRQEGHSEVTSVKNAITSGNDPQGADVYLYGHWWCCKNCWDTMIEAGINNVYLLEQSWELFNPENNPEMKDWGKPKEE
jgi:deoxycytidylate deaminase